MYEYVITCQKCGGQHSTSRLEQQANLSDAEVLQQAGHSPDCALAQSGKGTVQHEQRPNEPNVILYSIEELR